METRQNTNINLENYRKVVEAELELLRRENLNLKIVNYQLQEDISLLEEDFKQAQKKIREVSNDSNREKSVPLHVVKNESIAKSNT